VVVHVDAGFLCPQKSIEIESSSGAISNIKLLIRISGEVQPVRHLGNILGTS